MAATTYLGNMLLNAFLRGVEPTLPAELFVSLHTEDPTDAGNAGEVNTAAWPGYGRQSALGGEAIGAAFSAANAKATLSTQLMLWPAYDGAGTITLTHWAIWDAAAGGNPLFYGALRTNPSDPASALAPKTLGVSDEFVLYPGAIGVKVT